MAELHVELVSVESEVWSGEATQVVARTTEGEIGVLPGHAPLLGQLADGGTVRIFQTGGGEVVAAVHGGFLSVTDEGVTVLAEVAELGADLIDVSSGGNVPKADIPVGPGYQVPLAREVKQATGVPVGAVGLITDPVQAEQILSDGSADVVLLARAGLRERP